MSLAFLNTDSGADGPAAKSPFAHDLERAGAEFGTREGWELALSFGDTAGEIAACGTTVGWCDRSAIGKLELQGAASALTKLRTSLGLPKPKPGFASTKGAASWLALTPQRALVICEPHELPALRAKLGPACVDMTSSFAAMSIVGPRARDLFARFCALDLRPTEVPVGALRPGSVARMPAFVLCDGPDSFTVLFGAAYAGYFWEVVSDAGARLGGRPVGSDVLVASKESADA